MGLEADQLSTTVLYTGVRNQSLSVQVIDDTYDLGIFERGQSLLNLRTKYSTVGLTFFGTVRRTVASS